MKLTGGASNLNLEKKTLAVEKQCAEILHMETEKRLVGERMGSWGGAATNI